MGGPRPRARRLVLATAVAAPMLYARWLRPQLLTWGATPEETTGAYPGDKLVPDPDGGATMATTLPAPPERVWPWLVQMGLGRGGWYSWDWLDNDGAPSADRIVAHWQRLEVGQHLDRVPKGLTNWWIVAVLEPDRTLVLQGSYESLTGQGFDPRSGPRPWAWVEGVWGFHLQQAPGAGCSGEPPTGKSSCRAVAWCADRPSQLPVHRGGRGSPARILVAAWSADGLAAPLPDRLRPVTARTSPGYVGHQWTNPGGDGDLSDAAADDSPGMRLQDLGLPQPGAELSSRYRFLRNHPGVGARGRPAWLQPPRGRRGRCPAPPGPGSRAAAGGPAGTQRALDAAGAGVGSAGWPRQRPVRGRVQGPGCGVGIAGEAVK